MVLGDDNAEHHYDDQEKPQARRSRPAAQPRLTRKTPRFRTGLSWLTALGFQRLAANHACNVRLKIQKATAPR
ncbi:hypothetical protein AAE026_16095 [Bradyrhizobium sp. DN5]|uniref:hypothetical protein n=1 Tax=Bradyrhizobium sp. DN5 TaxID=3056950 RepID=UPI00352570AA